MVDGVADAMALLTESARQVGEVAALYEKGLHSQSLEPRLRPLVKNTLENQRSVLEYLAHEIVRRFGTAKGHTYYPIADDEAKFEAAQKSKLPGVASTRPDIIDTIRGSQPFTGADWIEHLVDYTNLMKHRGLAAQTRTEERWHTASSPSGSVSWNAAGVTFGEGVRIGGARVDPRTQMPVGGRVTTTILVGWNFEGTDVNVLSTLRAIQGALEEFVPRLVAIL